MTSFLSVTYFVLIFGKFYHTMNSIAMTPKNFLINSTDKKRGLKGKKISMVTHFEGRVNYTIIHFVDGTQQLSCYTLKRFEELLEKEIFIRIHRAFIVNLTFIHEIISIQNRQEVILQNGKKLSVARRRKI